MKLIFKYMKPYRGKLILLAFFYLISAATSLALPYLMSIIVDDGIKASNMNVVWIAGAAMVGIGLVSLVLSLFSNKITARVSAEYMASLRKDIFKKINSLSFEEFSSKGTAALLARSTEDVWMLQEASSGLVYFLVVVPVMFIGGIILTMVNDMTLGFILLGVSPVVIGIITLIGRKMFKLWRKADESMDLQGKVMRERLSGIRVIRSFDKEKHEHDRVADATENMAKNIIKSNVLSGFIDPVAQLLLNAVTVLIMFFGAQKMQLAGILTAGDIIATTQYVAVMMGGLLHLGFMIIFFPQVLVSSGRVKEVFDMKGIEMGSSSGEILPGSVTFENVDFAYPQASASSLTDISLEIKEGEVVGIIGGTGSGKTTLMKLLMNFYTPTKGKITLGGKDMAELSKATVRDNVSIALQKAMIFQGSIDYNVRLGRQDATDGEINEVCDIAQMQELIDSKEGGLKHKLAQAGANVSGGQKQRVSIARSILKKASIYVFDDSFSALDYLTESKLRKKLNKFLKGKTQIIITQRAATAMRCDKVFVMEEGAVVGYGTHKELLKNCETYKEIYASQLGGGLKND